MGFLKGLKDGLMLGKSLSQLINRSKEKNQILILIGTKKLFDGVGHRSVSDKNILDECRIKVLL